MTPFMAELVGTMLLVLLGNGTVANVLLSRTKGHNSGWIVIAFGYAMAVYIAIWCVGDYSGAHLNPAVTVGLAAAGKFDRSITEYVVAQLIGAIAGGTLVFWFYSLHFAATADPDLKLGVFCTAPAIRRPLSNLLSEVIGTFVLVFAVLLQVNPSISLAEEGATIGLGTLGALPVGLLILGIGLALGGTTGYAINPARDFGPRLAHAILPVPGKRDSDWGYAWIPVVGPLLGGLLAAGAYLALTQTAAPAAG
jgi:glycerol uptake facilitator protein